MYLFSLCDLFKLNELLKINQLEYYSMLYIKFDQHQRKPCLHCQGGHYGICHQVYLHFYKLFITAQREHKCIYTTTARCNEINAILNSLYKAYKL